MGFWSKLLGGSSTPSDNIFTPGYNRKYGIGSYSKLLDVSNNWYLWEVGVEGLVCLISYLPAKGSLPFEPNSAVFPHGGKGFYMNCTRPGEFYFDFYGEHKFRLYSIAEAEDRIIQSALSSYEDWISFDGKHIEFEVTTNNKKSSNREDGYKQVGELNFIGFELAFKKLKEASIELM